MTKYSELLVGWLKELGYTHCFFVAGGNIMHLLDGVRREMVCIPTVHEVAAGIATEYFNETEPQGRAFALVTAGPGLTNIVTALAGAYLESRELLVIGGQVKASDLADGGIRQRGIQEVDGVALAAPVCVAAQRFETPAPRAEIERLIRLGREGRPGPVFLEFCLDVQGAPVDPDALGVAGRTAVAIDPVGADIASQLEASSRPVLLIGGGVSRADAEAALPDLRRLGVPVMTTWNGIDRIAADEDIWQGRPNTWGMRFANVLLQQADVVVALGTRLGLQQTGFNWQQFAPQAKLVQVEIDPHELAKGHPRVDVPVAADAGATLRLLARNAKPEPQWAKWREFCDQVRELLPLVEEVNAPGEGSIDPFEFTLALSLIADKDDLVIPCSSGGAFTVAMQTWMQKAGQRIVTDKGLASMGYGLSGAIGAAIAFPGQRTIHLEGDGGFAQNLQEMATVRVNSLPIKTFLFANDGYASIRMTQRNYFDGHYLGCDTSSGLGSPDWPKLFESFGVPAITLGSDWATSESFLELFAAPGPAAFIVPIDPEQTYFPKISSRVTDSGSMESNPLHMMTPDLSSELATKVLPHMTKEDRA
ncbi:MAG: thiamine pyrophosphate-binding protein [Solirubrobacterales bacterium]|nr:thiamine pyrophosphate-binding protein [Solirubrobacterales bacterium]